MALEDKGDLQGRARALIADALELDPQDEKALELGGTCEGEPGPRGNFGEFAYFRDLDGNKLAVFHTGR